MTKKVLVLGAHGQIAQLAEKEFMEETDDERSFSYGMLSDSLHLTLTGKR